MIFNNDLNAIMSVSKDLSKDYNQVNIQFGEIHTIICSDINYSAFVYENNYRKESNCKLNLCNLIILDFDDGLTIEQAKDEFKDYSYFIATTKSHQKEKNGNICDRFRVVLPMLESWRWSIDDYKTMLNDIIEKYGADKAAKDTARLFYGNKNAEFLYNNGILFDCENMIKKAKKKIEIKKQYDSIILEHKHNITFDGSKIDTLRQIKHTDKMLRLLKFNERFGAGGRNTYLFACAKYLKDSGMTDEEVVSEVLWINSQGDGISENEIRHTIFKSLRIFN